jgi:hypothetical protein
LPCAEYENLHTAPRGKKGILAWMPEPGTQPAMDYPGLPE